MDLDLSDVEPFRLEVRSWLRTHVPQVPLPSLETADGFAAHREWERLLGAARLSVISWPARYGGRDATPLEWLVFEEEYYAAGAPGRVSQNGINLLAPTLLKHGTPDQLARILPAMASGETIWAQAWSEPGAGSDLASLRATATRTDGGWLLSGQKTWSSRAAFADRGFGPFRSDPESTRHHGLTYLMFDLRAPGVTARPIGRLDGKYAFAELFFDDVFVPDADVIGAPGEGWKVAMSTAGNERGLNLRSPGRFMAAADRLVALWKERPDPLVADRVAAAWIKARAYRLKGFETVSRSDDIGAEASINKIFWSEFDVELHETALELLGPGSELDPDRSDSWLEGYVFSLAGPIYAGTNEIQRNVVAERVLGLPEGQPMKFVLDAEQRLFGETLRRLLTAADLPKAIRSWACGAHDPGRAVWSALTEAGVFAIAVPEAFEGAGPLPVELATAAYELGRAGMPGPWVETFAAAELLSRLGGERLADIAAGPLATLAIPPDVPYALDADVADVVLLVDGADVHLGRASGAALTSLDPARRLFEIEATTLLGSSAEAVAAAYDVGVLACAAQLVGIGRALLEVSVAYAKARHQFGRPIGEFQAVKHHLATALVGLEYAMPLVYGAALSYGTPDFSRDVSAAKVSAAEAAYRTAKIALQVHGAIGYTDEYDPSLLIRKARALQAAWGSSSQHGARVLASL